MKKYKVTLRETVTYTVTVVANTKSDAGDLAVESFAEYNDFDSEGNSPIEIVSAVELA